LRFSFRGGAGDEATVRDFAAELADVRCWDAELQEVFEREGEGVADAALQNRAELIGLCELIEAETIRSYLEIGIWTGATVRALHQLFDFDLVAACDHGWCERFGLEIRLPQGCHFLRANSESDAFAEWRRALGHIDLVMIDANHHYKPVKRDFEINRGYPHRFLAFHDIVGDTPATNGVARLWDELEGDKRPIIRTPEPGLPNMGIGVWQAE